MKRLSLFLLPALTLAQTYKLEDVERLALKAHPAIAQSEAGVRAAEGMRKQAAYYPNPTIGLTADEIAGGPVIRHGEWGVFFEQRVVTGGKIGIDKRIAGAGIEAAKASGTVEFMLLRRMVRSLFYQALAEQRLASLRTQLLTTAKDSARNRRPVK